MAQSQGVSHSIDPVVIDALLEARSLLERTGACRGLRASEAEALEKLDAALKVLNVEPEYRHDVFLLD